MKKYKRRGSTWRWSSLYLQSFTTAADLKPVVVSRAYNPNTQEAKARESGYSFGYTATPPSQRNKQKKKTLIYAEQIEIFRV